MHLKNCFLRKGSQFYAQMWGIGPISLLQNPLLYLQPLCHIVRSQGSSDFHILCFSENNGIQGEAIRYYARKEDLKWEQLITRSNGKQNNCNDAKQKMSGQKCRDATDKFQHFQSFIKRIGKQLFPEFQHKIFCACARHSGHYQTRYNNNSNPICVHHNSSVFPWIKVNLILKEVNKTKLSPMTSLDKHI